MWVDALKGLTGSNSLWCDARVLVCVEKNALSGQCRVSMAFLGHGIGKVAFIKNKSVQRSTTASLRREGEKRWS